MAARKGSAQLAIAIIAVLILIVGGFFILKSLNKTSRQPQQQSSSSSQALPAGNSDAALDGSSQNINADLNQLSTDSNGIDQSLSDQPIDLTSQ